MIQKHHLIKRASDLITSEIDGETVMLSIENGKYYGLNSVGSRIWTLLEIPRTADELCNLLMDEFEVKSKECEQDVLQYLNTLANDNLVKIMDAKT